MRTPRSCSPNGFTTVKPYLRLTPSRTDDGAGVSAADPAPSQSDLASRMVAQSSDAIVTCDPEGRILLWNRGAEIIFGYPVGEAVGQSLDIIIPEHLRARHWEGYRRARRSGITRHADESLAVPGQRKNGTRISLEFKVTLLFGADGRPQAIAAILRTMSPAVGKPNGICGAN